MGSLDCLLQACPRSLLLSLVQDAPGTSCKGGHHIVMTAIAALTYMNSQHTNTLLGLLGVLLGLNVSVVVAFILVLCLICLVAMCEHPHD